MKRARLNVRSSDSSNPRKTRSTRCPERSATSVFFFQTVPYHSAINGYFCFINENRGYRSPKLAIKFLGTVTRSADDSSTPGRRSSISSYVEGGKHGSAGLSVNRKDT